MSTSELREQTYFLILKSRNLMKLCLNFMQFIEWQSHHLTYDYAIGIGCMKQGNFFSQQIKPAQVSLPNKNESMKTKYWSLASV